MASTPGYLTEGAYTESRTKALILCDSHQLLHAHRKLLGDARTLECGLIEARLTCEAKDLIIEDLQLGSVKDRETILRLKAEVEHLGKVSKQLIGQLNRRNTGGEKEFTVDDLREGSRVYCDLHGVKAVPMDTLKDWIRANRAEGGDL